MPPKGISTLHSGARAGMPYLSVISRQVGVAERWLRVHGLAVHVPHGWDKDEVGARATLSQHGRKREKNEHS